MTAFVAVPREAAQQLLDDLHARIDSAHLTDVPMFPGLAELRHALSTTNAAPTIPAGMVTGELPDVLPGHWTTPLGRDMAEATLDDPRMAASRARISDFALANKVFLSPSIANLTDAKERIRWLSATLAISIAAAPQAGTKA